MLAARVRGASAGASAELPSGGGDGPTAAEGASTTVSGAAGTNNSGSGSGRSSLFGRRRFTTVAASASAARRMASQLKNRGRGVPTTTSMVDAKLISNLRSEVEMYVVWSGVEWGARRAAGRGGGDAT